MKLLFYTDESSLGGVANWNHAILSAALGEGWELHSAQPVIESPMLAELEARGCRLHWIPYNVSEQFVRSMTDASDASRILAAVRPDLVVFCDCCPVSNIAAKHCAIKAGVPFVTVCHSCAPYLAAQFAQCLPIVRLQLARSAEVVAVSNSSLQVLVSHFGLARGGGCVVYSGRPARFFAPREPAAGAQERRALGVPDDAVLAVTAARLDADKGHDLQLAAIARLAADKALGRLHFAWAGEGRARGELQAAVRSLGLESRVLLTGQHRAVERLYDAADLFVLPTKHEAFGLSIAEAMAKGLPVLASRVGGVPEVLGEAGFYLPEPARDPSAVVEALTRLLPRLAEQPDLRAQVGNQARERALALFTETRMQQDFLSVLRRVAARPRDGANATVR